MQLLKTLFAILSLALATAAPAQETAPPANDQPAPPESQPQRPRQQIRRDRQLEARLRDKLEIVPNVVYATASTDDGRTIELKMDTAFLKQSDGKPMPAVVYVHGGGWRGGSKESGLRLSAAMALGGYFAASIQYRLSGEAQFPAAVHDCKAAIRFLRANAAELGIDPNRIGVWGHSAGGHLSALLGTSAGVKPLDGTVGEAPVETSTAVQCVVDISGPIDLSRDFVDGMISQWLGGPPQERPEIAAAASPITHLDPNDPPVLIIQGTEDNLVRMRHPEMFEKALKDAGVEVEFLKVEGDGHVIANPDAYLRAAEFFDKHLGGKATATMRDVMRQSRANANAPQR